jgi:mitogen-activated protein kinase organizer 1
MPPSRTKEIPERLSLTLECKQGAVRAVRHNQDGNYLLTCGSDKTLKLWNADRGLVLKTYTGHGYEVLDARGSCDNAQLVSCGMDKTVIVWEVATGTPVRKFRGHAGHAGVVNCVRFNEDSSVALSGSIDGTVKCWDVKSKRQEPIQTLEESGDSVTSLDVSDHEILVGSADCRVRRYDLRNGQMLVDYVGSPVSSVSFTKDGQCLLVSATNDTIKLFDKSTGELLQEFTVSYQFIVDQRYPTFLVHNP